jgi:hypothetical protein
MTDTAKQIIPDPNSVIRCLDSEMLEALNSHGTFVMSDLLEEVGEAEDSTILIEELYAIFSATRSDGRYSFDKFNKNISESIGLENIVILRMLMKGKNCSLLQPNSKGWQTGKLKLCFEFIPDETESEENNEKPTQTDRSPLDEIRNSLAVESN